MNRRFEVSGYDEANRFFVEWSAISARNRRWTLVLNTPIRADGWVFVRRSNSFLRTIPLCVVDCAPIRGQRLYRVLASPVERRSRQLRREAIRKTTFAGS
jgi:hypothetical protein